MNGNGLVIALWTTARVLLANINLAFAIKNIGLAIDKPDHLLIILAGIQLTAFTTLYFGIIKDYARFLL